MQLYLTSYDPSNSKYCAKNGKIVYKVACPSTMMRAQTATVWRSLPKLEVTSEETLWAEKHFGSDSYHVSKIPASDEEITEELRTSVESHDEQLRSWKGPRTVEEYQKLAAEMEADAGLTKIAEIELHTISATVIRHLGNEWKASDFFRKEGGSHYGSDRVFKGPDGKEYKWRMGSSVCELFLVDGDPSVKNGKAKIPILVARFHTPPNQKNAPPLLEIFPAGDDMVDWILITFVYIELLRYGRQIGALRGKSPVRDVSATSQARLLAAI